MAQHSEHPASFWTLASVVPPLIAAGLFAFFLSFLPAVAAGEGLRHAVPWVPSMGVELSFFIDGLSLTFALLISGIGVLVMLFSGSYLAGHPQHARFSLYLVSFMLAMLGLVLADNLLALFVFWELTTITSFLLIGFNHDSKVSQRAALQALLVTGTGGLAMLAGFLMIGSVAGTMELSALRDMGDVLRDSPMYLPILILVLAGAFTKSAQFPFHFWLPNAMAAPTPVSAYLHSATMVKGGVYLLARMHPNLSGTDVWMWTLVIFGAFTTVFASVVALKQNDLKQTLAYTTLMALGALVLYLAAPGGYAITAMATFLVVHSLYKAALFLMIGCVDHATGTRDARRLGGLIRRMPVTGIAGGLAALSMAGMIPFIGFIGKELLYKGGLESPASVVIVTGAIFAASALMFAIAGVVAFKPFWGTDAHMPQLDRPIREAPLPMLAGPVVLGALGLYFGLDSHTLQVAVTDPIAGALLGDMEKGKDLHLWTGVNAALVLSILTFATGVVIYVFHKALRDRIDEAAARLISFDAAWDSFLAGMTRGAVAVTAQLQTGVLSRYLLVVFATITVVIGGTILLRGLDIGSPVLDGISYVHLVVFGLTIAGTLVAVATNSRIAAIAGLGVVGIGVALVFIQFGAPDVAITQILVEMLVVVLFSVAALRLPTLPPARPVSERTLHAAVSIGLGVVVAAVVIGVTSVPLDLNLTEYFEKNSYPIAHGKNIVNVILVDFRAFDTFGEISVVAVAAISAYALLKQRKPKGTS
ncbi:Na(+)/H(+) antiporter subunit A [Meridianimarinicoccus roseus]|uniref:Na(+)/H(+) antiporter subunit A n=1 Tax=Meridianimarinicoccus roseus TaxID=2072018 RepID=A0A2V2LQ57_9RHOB|nr:hydrogen gas-evolving membrane-bound hydrogenase subunit E [Meridianimarinicoccus roseus]PWR04349.1 Na(+)/H(+) antiporter subunit A [Meridianimarinicoccus roseus]